MLGVVLLVALAPARSQSGSSAGPDEPDRSFKLLREDEDWSFLADPAKRQDFWDPLKYIRLREGRDDWFMTIGGEAREVWEQIGNDNWGEQPFWNGYLNQRYMPYFDVHYGKHVRTFVELKSGINSFRYPGPRPIDEKKLDFQAAFLQVGTALGQNFIDLRVGRHELEYGSGRLIDVREGPNVRLSFGGFVVKSKISRWLVDGFAVRPDVDNPGFFDNIPNHAVGFWGVYAVRTLPHNTSLDLYYLGLDRKEPPSSVALRRKCARPWAGEFRGLSQRNGQDGTSMMKLSGNSAALVLAVFRRGQSPQRRVTASRRFA